MSSSLSPIRDRNKTTSIASRLLPSPFAYLSEPTPPPPPQNEGYTSNVHVRAEAYIRKRRAESGLQMEGGSSNTTSRAAHSHNTASVPDDRIDHRPPADSFDEYFEEFHEVGYASATNTGDVGAAAASSPSSRNASPTRRPDGSDILDDLGLGGSGDDTARSSSPPSHTARKESRRELFLRIQARARRQRAAVMGEVDEDEEDEEFMRQEEEADKNYQGGNKLRINTTDSTSSQQHHQQPLSPRELLERRRTRREARRDAEALRLASEESKRAKEQHFSLLSSFNNQLRAAEKNELEKVIGGSAANTNKTTLISQDFTTVAVLAHSAAQRAAAVQQQQQQSVSSTPPTLTTPIPSLPRTGSTASASVLLPVVNRLASIVVLPSVAPAAPGSVFHFGGGGGANTAEQVTNGKPSTTKQLSYPDTIRPSAPPTAATTTTATTGRGRSKSTRADERRKEDAFQQEKRELVAFLLGREPESDEEMRMGGGGGEENEAAQLQQQQTQQSPQQSHARSESLSSPSRTGRRASPQRKRSVNFHRRRLSSPAPTSRRPATTPAGPAGALTDQQQQHPHKRRRLLKPSMRDLVRASEARLKLALDAKRLQAAHAAANSALPSSSPRAGPPGSSSIHPTAITTMQQNALSYAVRTMTLEKTRALEREKKAKILFQQVCGGSPVIGGLNLPLTATTAPVARHHLNEDKYGFGLDLGIDDLSRNIKQEQRLIRGLAPSSTYDEEKNSNSSQQQQSTQPTFSTTRRHLEKFHHAHRPSIDSTGGGTNIAAANNNTNHNLQTMSTGIPHNTISSPANPNLAVQYSTFASSKDSPHGGGGGDRGGETGDEGDDDSYDEDGNSTTDGRTDRPKREKSTKHAQQEKQQQDTGEYTAVSPELIAALLKATKRGEANTISTLIAQVTESQRLEFINNKDKNGSTPLFHCVWPGFLQAMKVLLQYGADPNIQNVKKNSALHLAVERGHLHLIRLLLEYKADITLLNYEGKVCYQMPFKEEDRITMERYIKNTQAEVKRGKKSTFKLDMASFVRKPEEDPFSAEYYEKNIFDTRRGKKSGSGSEVMEVKLEKKAEEVEVEELKRVMRVQQKGDCAAAATRVGSAGTNNQQQGITSTVCSVSNPLRPGSVPIYSPPHPVFNRFVRKALRDYILPTSCAAVNTTLASSAATSEDVLPVEGPTPSLLKERTAYRKWKRGQRKERKRKKREQEKLEQATAPTRQAEDTPSKVVEEEMKVNDAVPSQQLIIPINESPSLTPITSDASTILPPVDPSSMLIPPFLFSDDYNAHSHWITSLTPQTGFGRERTRMSADDWKSGEAQPPDGVKPSRYPTGFPFHDSEKVRPVVSLLTAPSLLMKAEEMGFIANEEVLQVKALQGTQALAHSTNSNAKSKKKESTTNNNQTSFERGAALLSQIAARSQQKCTEEEEKQESSSFDPRPGSTNWHASRYTSLPVHVSSSPAPAGFQSFTSQQQPPSLPTPNRPAFAVAEKRVMGLKVEEYLNRSAISVARTSTAPQHEASTATSIPLYSSFPTPSPPLSVSSRANAKRPPVVVASLHGNSTATIRPKTSGLPPPSSSRIVAPMPIASASARRVSSTRAVHSSAPSQSKACGVGVSIIASRFHITPQSHQAAISDLVARVTASSSNGTSLHPSDDSTYFHPAALLLR